MQIKPLHVLGHDETAELARNAAENAEPLHIANVFPAGTVQHAWFTHAYWARHRELSEAEA